MQLQDKIAVITGGASGLGLATARVLLARGVRVALFDLNAENGSAVAAELAADLSAPRVAAEAPGARLGAVVLQSPFSSARAMARVLSGEGLDRWWARIARVHFDTAARVSELDAPVWVAHGALDAVVPARMGREVFAAARRPGALLAVEGAGHNRVPECGGARYWRWLGDALDAARLAGAAATSAAL